MSDADALNQDASRWMKRGIALLDRGTPAELVEAIGYFDRAIDLRRRLPLDAVPLHRYGLAAGWLNRGDALTRLGGEDDVAAAVAAFDEGLRLLDGLPLDEPRVRRRAAIAWQNRGLALHAQGAASYADARRSFERARDLLDDPAATALPDRDVLAAAVWTNLANVWIAGDAPGAPHDARDAARRALASLAAHEPSTELVAAEAALKARHVLCQALGRILPSLGEDPAARRALVAEATDAIDDGLAIARRWEQRGVDRFRAIAYDLVRFGARIYATFQPHFLDEFMRENLDPAASSGHFVGSAEMRAAALESLWLSFRRS